MSLQRNLQDLERSRFDVLVIGGGASGAATAREAALRGLSTALIERAALAGMVEAFLEVRPSNTAAIRLYLALGFQQVGTRRGYYQAAGGREDAAVLKRALRSAAAPG